MIETHQESNIYHAQLEKNTMILRTYHVYNYGYVRFSFRCWAWQECVLERFQSSFNTSLQLVFIRLDV